MTTGTEISDHDLLRQYIAGSDSAFTALVARNIDAVYSAARRQVRDPHLAEDVTQAVFLILARKAWTLRSGVVIPAWLHRATRYCSANALRTQANRLRHERRAAQMKQDATADDWENVSAALDEAVASGSTSGFSETFEQLDELLVTLGASAGRAHLT